MISGNLSSLLPIEALRRFAIAENRDCLLILDYRLSSFRDAFVMTGCKHTH